VGKQIDKALDLKAISLEATETTSSWKVEVEKLVMEEAPEWLEKDANSGEEGESEEDVPLTVQTHLKEIESASTHHLHKDKQLGEDISLPFPP